MRIRLVPAVFVLAVLACPPFAWGIPPTQMEGLSCNTLGMTGMAVDHASLVACVLNAPDASATNCSSGCTWKKMSPDCSSVPTEIDTVDQSAVTFPVASQLCRARGGCWRLPSLDELSKFTGIPGATGNILWTRTYFLDGANHFHIYRIKLTGDYFHDIYCDDGMPAINYRCVR